MAYERYRVTLSEIIVCIKVNLVSVEEGRQRLKLRLLIVHPYPRRTRTGLWVTLVATPATLRMSLF